MRQQFGEPGDRMGRTTDLSESPPPMTCRFG
jgi:hypothetical protein